MIIICDCEPAQAYERLFEQASLNGYRTMFNLFVTIHEDLVTIIALSHCRPTTSRFCSSSTSGVLEIKTESHDKNVRTRWTSLKIRKRRDALQPYLPHAEKVH